MAADGIKHLLLTGPPGIGKTTIVKSVCSELSKCRRVNGFYTEEIRQSNGNRVGFDIVSLNGEREKLARISDSNEKSKLMIGRYIVFKNEFEKFALPILEKNNVNNSVVIIDEIGKMELLSDLFKTKVEEIFRNKNNAILATIPIAKEKPIPIVESLRNNPSCKIITVDKANRNNLSKEIVEHFAEGSKISFDKAELKNRLSPLQYHVTQECGTEHPFSGRFNEHRVLGTYICVVCSQPLFSSKSKFDSGCGWPAFSDVQGKVELTPDGSLGVTRTEVTCSECSAHLGHVFADGPPPTGQRFCINSNALNFTPEDK